MHEPGVTPADQVADTDQSNDGIDYIPVQPKAAKVSSVNHGMAIAAAPDLSPIPVSPDRKQPDHPQPSHKQTDSHQAESLAEPQQLAISGKDVLQQAILKLLSIARREVLVMLPSMHLLFDDARIAQALLDFIRYSAKRDVLILLNTLADQQATTHQLIKLAQRIPSRIALKQASSLLEPPVMVSDYLVVVDRTHILRIDDIDKYTGWFDLNQASRAQKYTASLLQQWPKAQEIAEFRQFTL